MFTVLTCNKFSRFGIVVADVGDNDPHELINKIPPRECPVCGPCSHVELSWRGRLEPHGGLFETDTAAIEHAREMVRLNPGFYDDRRIPQESMS
jgi:hypothetical protein